MAKAKTTLSLYWKCQLIGWSLASLYWGYVGYTGGGFILSLGILQFLTDVCLYILLTHLYRNLTLKYSWQNLPLNQTIKRIIPAVFIMGTCYTLVTAKKVYLLRSWFTPGFTTSFFSFFEANRLGMFIAGIRLMSIWLLAYHLYQYAQREIRVTKENARLAIISRDAQLNNLAAQLNPHFLFNSLNNIKALIIDQPKSARRAIDLLSELLRNGLYQGERQLVTITEEILIESLQPDILFLDIQMPQVSGFDLLESLESVPQVIFTTAFDQYAVKAFEVNALDYLMKPIREERFEKAIVQARLKLTTSANDRQFFIKDRQQYHFISWNKVHVITSMDNYARLYFDQKNTFLKTSLNQLEKKLDPDTFFRINRAQIINLHYIEQITTASNGRLIFTLRTGDVFEASDRQSVKFKNLKIT